MNNSIHSVRTYFLLLLAGITLILGACKKEAASLPYSEIEQFMVTDENGNEVGASIVDDEIILYWPPYNNAPEEINPKIVVSANASISPLSGAKVPFANGTTYTVTAQDGSVKKYRLKLVINQPQPEFSLGGFSYRIGDELRLEGRYLIGKDTAQTKVFAVNKDNKEFPLTTFNVRVFNSNRIFVRIPLQSDIDSGMYKIKLVVGTKTVISEATRIGRPQFAVTDASSTTVQKGGKLVFNMSGLIARFYTTDMGYVNLYDAVSGSSVKITDVVVSGSTCTITIPANLNYSQTNYIDFWSPSGEYFGQWDGSKAPVSFID